MIFKLKIDTANEPTEPVTVNLFLSQCPNGSVTLNLKRSDCSESTKLVTLTPTGKLLKHPFRPDRTDGKPSFLDTQIGLNGAEYITTEEVYWW